jgi:hypothetical protein
LIADVSEGGNWLCEFIVGMGWGGGEVGMMGFLLSCLYGYVRGVGRGGVWGWGGLIWLNWRGNGEVDEEGVFDGGIWGRWGEDFDMGGGEV